MSYPNGIEAAAMSAQGNRHDTLAGDITMHGVPVGGQSIGFNRNTPSPDDMATEGAKALEVLKVSGVMNQLIAQLPNTPVHAVAEVNQALADCTQALAELANCRSPREVAMAAQTIVAKVIDTATAATVSAKGEHSFEVAEHGAEFYGETYKKMVQELDAEWARIDNVVAQNNDIVNGIANDLGIDMQPFNAKHQELMDKRDAATSRVEKSGISVDIAVNSLDGAVHALEEARRNGTATPEQLAALEKAVTDAKQAVEDSRQAHQKEIEAEQIKQQAIQAKAREEQGTAYDTLGISEQSQDALDATQKDTERTREALARELAEGKDMEAQLRAQKEWEESRKAYEQQLAAVEEEAATKVRDAQAAIDAAVERGASKEELERLQADAQAATSAVDTLQASHDTIRTSLAEQSELNNDAISYNLKADAAIKKAESVMTSLSQEDREKASAVAASAVEGISPTEENPTPAKSVQLSGLANGRLSSITMPPLASSTTSSTAPTDPKVAEAAKAAAPKETKVSEAQEADNGDKSVQLAGNAEQKKQDGPTPC